MNEIVDFTSKRLGSRSRGGKIVQCPKCKQKGRLQKYTDGSADVTHRAKINLFGSLSIGTGDHCYFKWWPVNMASQVARAALKDERRDNGK